MNTKKLILINLILGILLITSCSNDKAQNTLKEYLDANQSLNFELAYSKLSEDDKSVESLSDYLKDNGDQELSLIKAFADKNSYKIISVTEENNTAKAVVEFTMPDGEIMASELMSSLFSKMFDEEMDESEISKIIEEKYKDKEIPLKTETDTIQMIKTSDGWFVFLDLKKKERIATLLSEAESLKSQKKLHGALEKYEQILELDSKMVEAKNGVEETTTEISLFEVKQKYIDKIELYDLKAKYYDTYFDGNVPGVNFKLRNNGDRTLNKVEVTVYFKDEDGSVIFEEDFHPVLVSEYSFNDDKPLKPNYVWNMGKGKFYKVEEVPSEWKTGSVTAKITDIEFE